MAPELGLDQEDVLPVGVAVACSQEQQTDKTVSREPEEQHLNTSGSRILAIFLQ